MPAVCTYVGVTVAEDDVVVAVIELLEVAVLVIVPEPVEEPEVGVVVPPVLLVVEAPEVDVVLQEVLLEVLADVVAVAVVVAVVRAQPLLRYSPSCRVPPHDCNQLPAQGRTRGRGSRIEPQLR